MPPAPLISTPWPLFRVLPPTHPHPHLRPPCRVPQIGSVFLNMPNLHFIPCNPVTSKFENDVYVATSEPHGNIEAVVTRGMVAPHAKL
jgi:hypothetical protein